MTSLFPAYATGIKILRSGRKELYISSPDFRQPRRVTQGGEAFYESPHYEFDLPHFCDDKREEKRQSFETLMETCGRVMSPERFTEQQKRNEQNMVMSLDMAQRLDRIGWGGFSNSPSTQRGQQLYFIGLFSGEGMGWPPFRRNKIIPLVAQEKRGDILRELTYFVENLPSGWSCRHWVLHDGPRCLADALKPRWRIQNRKINRFNESAIAARYDVEFVFRSNEAGSPLKKHHGKRWNPESKRYQRDYLRAGGERVRNVDEKGRQTYHPHTHCVLLMKRYLDKPDEFKNFIKEAQEFFGVQKIDHGALAEPREACKYVVKCDELQELRDQDLLAFVNGIQRAHLVAASGALREQIRAHKKNQIKLYMRTTIEDGKEVSRYTPLPNPNQTEFALEETKAEKDARRLAAMLARGDKPQILAITQPMAKFSPVHEPIIVCRGIGVTLAKLLENRRIRAVYDRYHDDYRTGADGLFMSHGGEPVAVAQAALSVARGEFLLTIPPFRPASAETHRSEATAGASLVGQNHKSDPPDPPGPEIFGVRGSENGETTLPTAQTISQKAETPVACAAGASLVGSTQTVWSL